jgi:cob(I)alamin adenosyltransferase
MPIYTRTGDKGQTSLFDGTRVLKSHIRVDTYGTIDELNSMLGAAIAQLKTGANDVEKELTKIQHDLLEIGSGLAMPEGMPVPQVANRPKEFEHLIDNWTQKMPELKSFILPGGGKAGSLLHTARTICRRAERRVVELMQEEIVDESIVKYLNRLSDLLFTMARYVNYNEKKKETKWIKK